MHLPRRVAGGGEGPDDAQEQRHDAERVGDDPAVAARRIRVQERVGIPVGAWATDHGVDAEGEPEDQPDQRVAHGQPVAGRVDEPIHDHHDRHELVEDEVDPRFGEVELVRQAGKQRREDDERGRHVGDDGAAEQVPARCRSVTAQREDRPGQQHEDCQQVALDGEEAEEIDQIRVVLGDADVELVADRRQRQQAKPNSQVVIPGVFRHSGSFGSAFWRCAERLPASYMRAPCNSVVPARKP